MTRTTLTLTAAALALTVPALAAAQTQGKAQLADILGVEADKFTLSQLVELDDAVADNDTDKVNYLLEEAGSDATAAELKTGYAETGMVQARDWFDRDYESGKEQLASNVGVPADAFTLGQLVRLDSAIGDDDQETVEAILSEADVSVTAQDLMR